MKKLTIVQFAAACHGKERKQPTVQDVKQKETPGAGNQSGTKLTRFLACGLSRSADFVEVPKLCSYISISYQMYFSVIYS